METITLNNGTVLDGHIMPNGDDRIIFVYLTGISLADGFAAFSNPANISTITEINHGNEHIYRGYTELKAIDSEFGNCNITLRKP